MVTLVPPLAAAFEVAAADIPGESNVNTRSLVLTSDATVITFDLTKLEAAVRARSEPPHLTEVSVDHTVVAHICSSSAIAAVGVISFLENSNPRSVMDCMLDVGKLLGVAKLTTGALYENRLSLVPTTAATVTATVTSLPLAVGVRQISREFVTQLVVWHNVFPTCTVGLVFEVTKLIPLTLIVSPPVPAELYVWVDERMGASKVKVPAAVPTTAAMVTDRPFWVPY